MIHQAVAISRKQRPISATEMRKALRNAAEEDERSSAEEEYRRAEERRRERDEEKRKVTEEASRRAEEDRLMQEESTRKKKPPRVSLPTTTSDRDESSAQEVPRNQPSPIVPGATVEAQESLADHQAPLPPAMKTIPAPAPEPVAFGQPSESRQTYQSQTAASRTSKRIPLMIAAAVVVVLGGVSGIWLMNSNPGPTAIRQPTVQNGTSPTNLSLSNTAPAGMVYVPGGEFTMGRDDGDEYERPAHKVTVQPFFIDQYEVTNEDYAKFVKATGHRAPSNWVNGNYPAGAARKPVTGVTWDDATAYARWAGKRLPTEEEWEFAARGTDGRIYPWGNDWSAGLANAEGASNGTVDVGTYKGTSPFGASDMVGNVWQWTASKLTAYPGGSIPTQAAANLKVIRGCTYACKSSQATATYRRGWPAIGADYTNTGFRCVADASK